MKLNLKALTLAAAIVWAGVVFMVGVANSIWPEYGKAFLMMLASVYPGFTASGTFADAIVGSLYAVIDAAVVGLVFGWLYNLVAGAKRA
jgi:ABC-type phosphate transport system permease subunit